MKGFLNQQQLDYILFHLQHHVILKGEITRSFVFAKAESEIENYSNKIIFLLSPEPLKNPITIKGIPVLFPILGTDSFYKVTKGNLVFQHDLLKSAFFLLSGYQEYKATTKDSLGRFPYPSSIQSRYNFVGKPIVNYYFKIIIEGIREFCEANQICLVKKTAYRNFAFFLTHDVDRVKYYNLNTFLYNLKTVLGFTTPTINKKDQIRTLISIGINLANIFRKTDPYWNFAFLHDLEKQFGLKSTYFFLPKDTKHVDAQYSFSQKSIRELLRFLMANGNEIGLPGTALSAHSLEALSSNKQELEQAIANKVKGIRQHRLLWVHPATGINQDEVGFLYDTSLGFAAHEGFRNSYAHPFKLYDFENNRMLNHWEIPLNLMDATLFFYRKLTFEDARRSVESLIAEVKKFNGVFTLLWHNSYLNEREQPGITKFYVDLLHQISNHDPESLLGVDIINRLNTSNCG